MRAILALPPPGSGRPVGRAARAAPLTCADSTRRIQAETPSGDVPADLGSSVAASDARYQRHPQAVRGGALHSALMSRRIGVMGGTFDPIHHGHLVAAEEARWQFSLDSVVFVPTGRPWQKPFGVTPAEDRYEMTLIATASNPAFTVSRLEIDHEGSTYTVDTLRRLRDRQDESTRLFFITGADAVLQILTWKEPDQVLALAEFIAATRPSFDLDRLVNQVPGAAGRVHRMDIPALAISSSDIRARVARGAPIQYLVPDGVARYIQQHGLYRTTPGPDPPAPPPGSGTQ